jgi:hypothetical protein
MLWFTALRCEHVIKGKRTEPPLTAEEEKDFTAADNLFRLALISILAESMVPAHMDLPSGKEMWDALEAKFGVTDAGNVLYKMEQFYDYKMIDDRSVVEQAHELQMLAKELKNMECDLSNQFVAGGIIAKLPPAWSGFATSLKHRRQEFSVTDLIAILGVEENARAKDTRAKKVAHEGASSANMVQKKNTHAAHKKKKGKDAVKPKAASFKKKNKEKSVCFVCGATDHWAKECPDCKDKQNKKVNMIVSEARGPGYGNYLPTILSVSLSPEWWVDTGANIHVCADISLFSSYQIGRGSSQLMENGTHAVVHGVATVNLKFTSKKIV